jgi:hypothetical protein
MSAIQRIRFTVTFYWGQDNEHNASQEVNGDYVNRRGIINRNGVV